eukprot:GGOE01041043.1.p1 GENE.GGOE01041043.1~~GGOE01041043.1.p1  ORF type:complete len:263 (-),score=31.56 GGOE01041043.1:221-1009(-)
MDRADEYTNRLLELEERFNREMEAARKHDLTEKEALKQRHRAARVEHMEEFVRASSAKATALVELFRQREVELENEFRRILEVERKKWSIMLHDRDEEIGELRAQLSLNVAPKSEVQVIREVEVPSKVEIPFFGIEVESTMGVTEPGVRVVAVTGPSAAAGLIAGDLIHQVIIPVQVRSQDDFLRALSKSEAGDRVHIAVIRDNQLEKVVVVPEKHATAPKVIDRVVAAPNVSYTASVRAPSPIQMASAPRASPRNQVVYFE